MQQRFSSSKILMLASAVLVTKRMLWFALFTLMMLPVMPGDRLCRVVGLQFGLQNGVASPCPLTPLKRTWTQ
jgi:hypothetical protein